MRYYNGFDCQCFFLVFSWRCTMQKWQNWWFYHCEESILEVLENDETTFIAHSFSLHLLVTATLLTLLGTPLVLEHASFASKPTCICTEAHFRAFCCDPFLCTSSACAVVERTLSFASCGPTSVFLQHLGHLRKLVGKQK